MRFNSDWLARYLARENVRRGAKPVPADAVEHESVLHEEILSECRRRGWLPIHARMDAPTTTACGVCDFVILCEWPRVLLVEAKSKTGKLTPGQLQFIAWAAKLHHTVHVVQSFSEFLDACKEQK